MTPPSNDAGNQTAGRGVDLFFGDDPESQDAPAAAEQTATEAVNSAGDEATDAYEQAVEGAYAATDVTVEEAEELRQSAGESANGSVPAEAVPALPPPETAAPPPPAPPPPVQTAAPAGGDSSRGCLIGLGALLLGALLGAALALVVLFSTNSGLTYASRNQVQGLASSAAQLRQSADALRDDVTSLQTALGVAQGQLDTLSQRQEAISQSVSGLSQMQQTTGEQLTAVTEKAAAIDGIQEEISQTQTTLDGVQGNLADVTDQVGVVASQMTTVTEQLEEVAVTAQRSDNFLDGLTALLASLDNKGPEASAALTETLVATPTLTVTATVTPSETLTTTVTPTPTETLTPSTGLTPTIAVTVTATPELTATVAPTATTVSTPTAAPDTTPSPGPGAIRGMVYFDRDQSGARNGTVEPGIAGVAISLFTQDRQLVAQTTTDFRGLFGFTGLEPGIYVVVETDPPNFLSSTPNNYTVRITGATPIPEVSFGDYR